MLSPGDVILIYCRNLKDPHDKFAVCVCPKRKWFFFINSEPRKRKPDAQVEIRTYELASLDHDSWIDTSSIKSFSDAELIPAKRDRNRHKGTLSPAVRLKIKKAVREHNRLSEVQAKVIDENL